MITTTGFTNYSCNDDDYYDGDGLGVGAGNGCRGYGYGYGFGFGHGSGGNGHGYGYNYGDEDGEGLGYVDDSHDGEDNLLLTCDDALVALQHISP